MRIYRWLWCVLMPFVLLRLWWRGRRQPAYRQHWRERLGHVSAKHAVDVWWHAVSVGEVVASVPAIRALRKQLPNVHVWITVSTPTGRQTLQDRLPELTDFSYAPMDQAGCVRRFLQNVRPSLLVIMETEIWPEWLRQAEEGGIPVVLANARLSEKSYQGYARLGSFAHNVMQGFSAVAAQSSADADRFKRLGCDPDRVQVMGNVKFDMPVPATARQKGNALREQWGVRSVWLAASTHSGEEELILAAHQDVLTQFPETLLVLVPRHPDRFNTVAESVVSFQWRLVRRSESGVVEAETQVYLGDTMGELFVLMSACDLVFVGGSLVPHGGHNMLEPLLCGVPVLTGPYTHNFSQIHRMLEEKSAIRTVRSSAELSSAVMTLMASKDARQELTQAGGQVLRENQGAADRLLKLIREYLGV